MRTRRMALMVDAAANRVLVSKVASSHEGKVEGVQQK